MFDDFGLPDAATAALFTAFGALLLKIVDHFLGEHKTADDHRTLLNNEITSLQNRLDKVEEEVTFWRNNYYAEQEHNAILRVQMIQQGITPVDITTLGANRKDDLTPKPSKESSSK